MDFGSFDVQSRVAEYCARWSRCACSQSNPRLGRLRASSRAVRLCSAVLLAIVAVSGAAIPQQAVIPLYLSNSTLDSYQGRRGSNTAYFGVYEVGTPPQQFTGCFDTGSADAWLPLASCLSEACVSHDVYMPNASSTYKATSTQFSIQYATGSVSGSVARDTMRFGNIVVEDQAFGNANVAGDALLQSSCDGIFGLGLPQMSQMNATPAFFTMISRSLLAEDTVSFWLSPDSSATPAGELVIGGVNNARVSGPVTRLDVQNRQYWALPLTGAAVGTAAVQLSATSAILDTGSTAITVGAVDGAALHELIPGAAYWSSVGVYNISGGCANIDRLPSVSLTLGNTTFTVPPSLWVIKLLDTCVSGFVPTGRGTQVVLGVPFLRAWHTRYTYNNATQTATIGLAKPAAAAQATTAASSGVLTFSGRRLRGRRAERWDDRIFGASIPSAAERGLE